MLFMIQKPRPTLPERGRAMLSRAARALSAAPAGLAAALFGPFRLLARGLAQGLENRRMIDALAAMSDRDLRDIGLVRGDIRDAMSIPAGSDGSLFLAGRRDAHRGYRSAR